MFDFALGKSGLTVPGLGFGTWQVPSESVGSLVKDAIESGYKHIDCAHVYTNEEALGEYLKTLPNRSDIFFTSKLWGTDHEPSRVRPACQLTLDRLKIGYLDLYLVHNPCRMDHTADNLFTSLYYKKEWVLETWREMEKLVEAGLCKTVGVSNFTTTKLSWILDEGCVSPSANQVELHPYLPQKKLLKFCQDNSIHVTAYSPLGSPATQDTPFGNKLAKVLLKDELVNTIADAHSATPAQVVIAWGLARGTSVLVKSSSHSRIVENFQAQQLKLTSSELEQLSNINYQARYLDFELFTHDGDVMKYWDGELYN